MRAQHQDAKHVSTTLKLTGEEAKRTSVRYGDGEGEEEEEEEEEEGERLGKV